MTKKRPGPKGSGATKGKATSGDVARPDPAKVVFDPWRIIDRGEPDHGLTELQRLQLALARDLDAHRPQAGFDVLRAVTQCAGNRIPVPEWLAIDLAARLNRITALEVASLDHPAVFGPLPAFSGQRRTAALRKKWSIIVKAMFRPSGPFPRTANGLHDAAAISGLTQRQLRDLLPRTRKNQKGHKPYAPPAAATTTASAHDPFSLIQKVPKR